MSKKILAIIPARAGSKRIPHKNIRFLGGKPMIAYIIETAKKVNALDRVIVSTEDSEIATIAEKYGAEIPFMRPKELATDEVATLPVLQHALKELEKQGYVPDYVLLLYATSPLLLAERIEQAIDLALTKDADAVLSGTLDKGHYWIETKKGYERLYPLIVKNSQLTKAIFKENGAIYLAKTGIMRQNNSPNIILPFIMEEGENIDVDTIEDFDRVEKILKLRTKN